MGGGDKKKELSFQVPVSPHPILTVHITTTRQVIHHATSPADRVLRGEGLTMVTPPDRVVRGDSFPAVDQSISHTD